MCRDCTELITTFILFVSNSHVKNTKDKFCDPFALGTDYSAVIDNTSASF